MLKKIISTAIILMFSFTVAYAAQAFQIEEATIESLQEALKNHQITCVDLIKRYLDRIKKYNLNLSNKAPLNAFTQLNPYVLTQAAELDAAFNRTEKLTGTLHCVPVVVKDNINTYDETTSSGSYALLGTQPLQDAFLVTQLRNAGAIILGKTAMDEMAAGLYGISSRSGRVGNAYRTEANPGGSSSGSAVAVSSNFAVIGMGSDNSLSVRAPAAFNGVVGLRPSAGLISQQGILPAGNLDGTAGPMARTVTDLARVLDVIAREDHLDKKTLNIPRPKTYLDFLNPNGLKGKRIGILHRVGKFDVVKNISSDLADSLKLAIQKMQIAGATIINEVNLPDFNNDRKNNMAGMREDLNEYFASFPAARKDVIDFCTSDRSRVYGNPKECLTFINAMPLKNSEKYKNTIQMFAKNKEYVEKIMAENHLDALLMPIATTGGATYDHLKVNTWQAPVASNTGMPAITINIGYTQDNLPIGVELIGKPFGEGTLIEMAYAYEQANAPRCQPVLPVANDDLENFSIADLNNLFTAIGVKAYDQVLKNNKVLALTPAIFKQITFSEIEKMKANKE